MSIADNTLYDNPFNSSAVPILLGGSFDNPQGTALDGYGNVYVGDIGNHAVYEILAAGGYTTIKTLGGGFYFPAGIAVDGIGNVYVSDEGDGVVSEMPLRCASSSCVTTIGGGFRQGMGFAVDGIGNVYVADIAATVARIPPGCLSSSCVTTVGGGFVQPYGVAVDAGGNVYVADRQNQQVMMMSADCASASCVEPLGGGFTDLRHQLSCSVGSACGLDIEFTPATLGSPLNGSVNINDNDLFNPGATQAIDLMGSGVQQTPSLTLASVATVGMATTPCCGFGLCGRAPESPQPARLLSASITAPR